MEYVFGCWVANETEVVDSAFLFLRKSSVFILEHYDGPESLEQIVLTAEARGLSSRIRDTIQPELREAIDPRGPDGFTSPIDQVQQWLSLRELWRLRLSLCGGS